MMHVFVCAAKTDGSHWLFKRKLFLSTHWLDEFDIERLFVCTSACARVCVCLSVRCNVSVTCRAFPIVARNNNKQLREETAKKRYRERIVFLVRSLVLPWNPIHISLCIYCFLTRRSVEYTLILENQSYM